MSVVPPTKNAITNTHPNSRIVSRMLFDPMAVSTFTNGGAESLYAVDDPALSRNCEPNAPR